MAICVIAVVGVAPCQCFSPSANQTTSPGRISSTGPPSRCAQPSPEVTINVWPNGCVCHAVRAPGSNVTLAPRTRAGSGASNSGSIRTVPVNQSAGPFVEGCEADLLISIYQSDRLELHLWMSLACQAVALAKAGHVSLNAAPHPFVSNGQFKMRFVISLIITPDRVPTAREVDIAIASCVST